MKIIKMNRHGLHGPANMCIEYNRSKEASAFRKNELSGPPILLFAVALI